VTSALAAAVRELAPALFPRQPPGVIRIETTRPTFLLFASDWRQPACVAQIGSREQLERLHAILTTLHSRVPDLVPASIACVPWHAGQYLHLQAGLPGVPWFRLRARLRTAEEWTQLQVRAGQALERLHAAAAESQEWRSHVRPADELLRQITLLTDRDRNWPSHIIDAVEQQAHRLRALGAIDWVWQHGDFCVNNLLVAPTSLAIIDFEEFGATAVPLHDEIGLGLSMHEFSSAEYNWKDADERIRACVDSTLRTWPQLAVYLPAFVLHHLVLRINQCHDRPRRQAVRALLATMLKDCVESSEEVLPRP
jgi:aminoglycoside phosphotransferase